MTSTITRRRRCMALCLLMMGGAAHASAATITIGPGASIQGNDVGSTNSFVIGQGQTFVVPMGFATLESFSMAYTAHDVNRPATPSLAFEIWEWTGSTTGALIASAPLPITSNNGTTPVFTGPLTLTEGASYLAFFRSVDLLVSLWRHPSADLYADGLWVVTADPPNFETLINGNGPFDTRFSATFSSDDPPSVPEPATLTLLGVGLAALTSRRARRRPRQHG